MLQNLQNFAKFQKLQLDNLVDFEKCCKTRILKLFSCKDRCRYIGRRATFCRNVTKKTRCMSAFVAVSSPSSWPLAPCHRRRISVRAAIHRSMSGVTPTTNRHVGRRRPPGPSGLIRQILQFFAKFCKFLAGSFSAVSKRSFARKYAFDSIFQVLQDLHTFAPLQSQNIRKNRFEKSAIS